MAKVVAPLQQVGKTKVMMTSSPQGPDNFYSRLVKTINPVTGRPFIRAVIAEQACPKCIRNGEKDSCEEFRNEYPDWLKKDRDALSLMLMDGDAKTFNQENRGEIGGDDNCQFAPDLLRRLRTNPLYQYDADHPAVEVLFSADLNYGGKNNFSLVASTLIKNQLIILGMLDYNCKPFYEQDALFDDFIVQVMSHPFCRTAVYWFAAELNNGREAERLASIFLKYKRTYAIRKDDESRYGLNTSDRSKQMYKERFAEWLENDAIFFCKDWVSCNRYLKLPRDELKKNIFNKALEQLGNMRDMEIVTYKGTHYYFTGKAGSDNKFQKERNDDLAVTILFNCGTWGFIVGKLLRQFPYVLRQKLLFHQN